MLRGVQQHYAWSAHAKSYLAAVQPLLDNRRPSRAPAMRRPGLYHDRAIITDLDQNLLGDPESLAEFVGVVRAQRKCASFGIATGRSLESALKVMRKYGIPTPDVLISSLGAAIHFAPEYAMDLAWVRHIDHLWTPAAVRAILDELPGLKRQPKSEQGRFKISYYIDPRVAPPLEEINRRLLEAAQRGLWQTAAELLEELKETYMEVEGWMEEKMGDVTGEFQGGAIDIITADDVPAWKEKLKPAR